MEIIPVLQKLVGWAYHVSAQDKMSHFDKVKNDLSAKKQYLNN